MSNLALNNALQLPKPFMKWAGGKLREQKGFTQAERADMHNSYISQIARDIRYPFLKTLFKITDALNAKISYLFKRI
jgi:transcriptional regulator with XRE-family HTH domain